MAIFLIVSTAVTIVVGIIITLSTLAATTGSADTRKQILIFDQLPTIYDDLSESKPTLSADVIRFSDTVQEVTKPIWSGDDVTKNPDDVHDVTKHTPILHG